MSNLKIHGSTPGAEAARPDTSPQSHSADHPEHTNGRPDKTFAHDSTPARQREFEAQGHQTRSLVDGYSDQHGHNLRSATLKLDAGTGRNYIGVDTGRDGVGPKLNHPPGLSLRAGESPLHATQHESSRSVSGLLRPTNSTADAGRSVSTRQGNGEPLSSTLSGAKRTLAETVRTVSDQLRIPGRDPQRQAPASVSRANTYADRLIARANHALDNRLSNGGRPETVARQIISDVVSIGQLDSHFSRLERMGGEPVRQAYRAAMEFLLGQRTGGENDRLKFATDLLRDLQGGMFLYQENLDGPFPLTGRARLVSEMIELMRTLEAFEAFAEGSHGAGSKGALPTLLSGGGLAGSELAAVIEQWLTDARPTLPGLAGRLEIPRVIAALNGLLNDADGKPLLMIDGKPLKVGELLWLNTLANNTSWATDRTSSSPLVYGFDSIFSLIGFDGRSLALPRFLAIQSQVNASEFEWVFGQAPLSEGWMRSAIELLKDSRAFDHNLLGEMLEEALTNGGLHLLVMRGTVEEGKPVAGSFSLSPVDNFG